MFGRIVGMIVGSLFYCIVMGVLTNQLRKHKKYDGGFWLGFFLGVFGLLYCIGLPDRTKYQIVIKKVKTLNDTYEVEYSEIDDSAQEEVSITNDDSDNLIINNDNETSKKNEIVCAVCGSKLSKNSNKCIVCGNSTYICPNCSNQVFPEDKCCSNCGQKRSKDIKNRD